MTTKPDPHLADYAHAVLAFKPTKRERYTLADGVERTVIPASLWRKARAVAAAVEKGERK